MRILVLGATGYVGSVVARHVADAGHEVVGLVRPGRPVPPGDAVAEARPGDLTDPASLTAAVTADIGAVVHVAAPTGEEATDRAATEALLTPLHGTGRPFLYVSGTWVLGRTGRAVATEETAVDPIDIVRHRPAIEQQVLAAAHHGVRPLVVRPGVVHGHGGGIPRLLVDLARQHGIGVHVGPGTAHWPMVHVDDLADLVVAALGAPAGTLVHAVAEPAVPVTDLAAAAALVAGVAPGVRHWPLAEAAAVLGQPFAEALAIDQTVSGDRARRVLGWDPRRVGAVADLATGSYAADRLAG